MTEPAAVPNFAEDLRRIHRVITRAIQVGLDSSARFSNGDQPDEKTRAGFTSYVRTLTDLLHSHHSGEDEIAFPEVETRIPSAPVGVLCAEHEEITVIIERIKALLSTPDGDARGKETMAALHREFKLLHEIWHRHIHLEEDVFSAKNIQAAFKAAEQVDLNRRLSEHGQAAGGPPFLLLPFVLYNLEGEDRQHMARMFPPEVTNHLIPVAWLDQWSVMKPFLLD